MHYEAYVDSLYGFVDAIEHGLYSSCIGCVEQIHLLHDGYLHIAEEVHESCRMHVHMHLFDAAKVQIFLYIGKMWGEESVAKTCL